MRPWETLERVERREGTLALVRRGNDDFLITLGPRVLMTSRASRSERELALAACTPVAGRATPHVLIGGLGMGCTLRAALDVLPPRARVVVAEIEPAVVRWCRGPLAPLCGDALGDPRVGVVVQDVAVPLAAAAAGERPAWDAVALDLFEGPRGGRAEARHPLYGDAALSRLRRALRPDGWLAVWSEAPGPGFEQRLGRAGFAVRTRRVGRGGRRHVIHVGGPLADDGDERARRARARRARPPPARAPCSRAPVLFSGAPRVLRWAARAGTAPPTEAPCPTIRRPSTRRSAPGSAPAAR